MILGLRLFGAGGPLIFHPTLRGVTINGVITGDRDTLKLISKVANSQAAAVLISIDSPGRHDDGRGAAL